MYQNLTQEGLRELTGLSVDTIHRIESGRSDPKVSHLHRIAIALEMELADLFRDEPDRPADAPAVVDSDRADRTDG
jgi:transcriptional regulator with XRE-family HTH domain